MWIAVNIPRHLFEHNHAEVLSEHLNKIGATVFHLLSEDTAGDIDGIAWVP